MSTPLRERPDAPLGTLIFRAGLLPAETIESALEEGVKTGKRLGEILTERGLISELDLARLLAGQKGLEFVILREQIVEPSAAALFTEEQARLFRALPYAFDGELPVVAIADPTDDVLIRNIREALGREDARFVVTARTELAEISADVYSRPLETATEPEALDTAHANGHASGSAEIVLETPVAPEPPAFQVPVAEPAAPESPTVSEPEPEPEPASISEPPSPPEHQLAPEPEPTAETAPAVEAVPEPPAAPKPPVLEQPTAEPEPAAPAEPEPFTEPYAPEPSPQAEAPLQPAPALAEEPPPGHEPLAAEPVPFPEPTPAPSPAPYPPAASEPAAEPEPAPEPPVAPLAGPEAAGAPWRMTIRLTNGERVDAGEFPDEASAKQEAKAIMMQVATADQDDWPYVSGRFLKPDTIVSVDIAEHDGDDD
jgi:Type II secretion system (T2SS), protein E, N-terminal domain